MAGHTDSSSLAATNTPSGIAAEQANPTTRTSVFSASSSLVSDTVRLLRPLHWPKNVFVLAPLVFSGLWTSPASVLAATVAAGLFCMLSSAVYAFNDVIDAPADRMHPRKRMRPIAAGRLYPGYAVTLAVVLVAAALGLSWQLLPWLFTAWATAYLVNNLAYCTILKRRVVLDVMLIAVGFVIRLLAGCAAIGVAPSSWLLVCGFSLALVLGFGKRRVEITNVQHHGEYRKTLLSYDRPKLDVILGVSTAVCLLAYIMYTVSLHTIATHGTERLVYTVPFVVYGLFRYILKVHEAKGDGPVEILMKDPAFIATGIGWLAAVVLILRLSS